MSAGEYILKAVGAATSIAMVYLIGRAIYSSLREKDAIEPSGLETMTKDHKVNLRHAIKLDALATRHPVTASELARQYGTSEVQLSMLRKEVNESL